MNNFHRHKMEDRNYNILFEALVAHFTFIFHKPELLHHDSNQTDVTIPFITQFIHQIFCNHPVTFT